LNFGRIYSKNKNEIVNNKQSDEQSLQLKTYEIMQDKELKLNSELIPIQADKVYRWIFLVSGIKGTKKSAYGFISFGEEKTEIARRVRFITDWSNKQKKYEIITAVPHQVKFARLCFRVNCERAEPADTIIKLPPIENLSLELVDDYTLQTYDDSFDYAEDWKKYDLEENYWYPAGSFKTKEEYTQAGYVHAEILKHFGLEPTSLLLDIGCATGSVLRNLKDYLSSPKNYVGIDIAEEPINYCKKHFPDSQFYKNDRTSLPQMNQKFDMICLFSVFTHMYPDQIVEFLKNMKNYLNPNGSIVATMHKNSKLKTYTGNYDSMEFNENYFFKIVRSVGYTKIIPHQKNLDNTQITYKIS